MINFRSIATFHSISTANQIPPSNGLSQSLRFLPKDRMQVRGTRLIITVHFVVNSYSSYMRQYVEISTRQFMHEKSKREL
jgi:hypothetical protein